MTKPTDEERIAMAHSRLDNVPQRSGTDDDCPGCGATVEELHGITSDQLVCTHEWHFRQEGDEQADGSVR